MEEEHPDDTSVSETEEKKTDEALSNPDDVAKRLRDKIRLQAESLLNQVEVREEKLKSPERDTKRAVSISTSTNNTLAKKTSDLTKRLQKLAVSRLNDHTNDRLKVLQSDPNSHLSSVKTFQELNLPKYLLDAVFAMGFDRPSTIQTEALPRILAGKNIMGQAQSGSGKTAAFCLGMLNIIDLSNPGLQAICVTPTRELAIQIVEQAVKPLSRYMDHFKVELAIASSQKQKSKRIDAQLIVGTPGKLVDWLKRKYIQTSQVKMLVYDEADNMMDSHRANSILIQKNLPNDIQIVLFSATFPTSILDFARKLVHECDQILLESHESLVLDVIKQLRVDVRPYTGGKLEFLADIYSLLTIGQSIVFVNTKNEANEIHETLSNSGYTCSVLHSGIDNRDETMEAFRSNQSNVLITTNVLARGVDVDRVCLVINYNIPKLQDDTADFETYLHRIGRTGRFGRKGTAINFVQTDQDIVLLQSIEGHFSHTIAQVDPDPEALAEMIEI